jgi:hypothetical protein
LGGEALRFAGQSVTSVPSGGTELLIAECPASVGHLHFPQLLAGDAPLDGLNDLLMALLARLAGDLIKWVVNKLREWWRQKT